MCIDEGSKVSFGVFPGAGQLVCYVRCAASGCAAGEGGVRCYVGDVNAVGPSIAALEDASTYAFGVVKMVRDVEETATVGIYVLILCHGEATSK
jgi:hypothetical protein